LYLKVLFVNATALGGAGTKCIANAYSYHHDLIESGTIGTAESIYLHVVDTVGIVHAIILRLQALLLPVKILVFSGH